MGSERGLLLRCGRLFDVRRQTLAGPADVLVEDGSVVSIAPALDPRGARVVDLRDCTLLPGLVDLDVDLLPERVCGDTGLWLFEAVAAARDLLRRGVTTARVLGGSDQRWSLIDLRRAIVDGLAPGCELVVAPHRLDGRRSGAVAALVRAVARERRNGADWIAVDGGAMAPGELEAVVHEAQDTPVAVAAQTPAEARSAIAAGARSVEASCTLDAATARMAVERGVYVVPRDGFGASAPDGLALCFGGRLGGGVGALAQIVGAPAALAAATGTAAACARLPDRGAIAPGRRADLVAVAGDPLAEIEALGQVSLVVKQGRIQP